ncbi:hypothetical protein HU200_040863 [Digitaria exilis]|uniref:Rx N-terminal domain-containing protein n=1 Tax=Digitaria exilis TaxID=1010633 RepID=A0A835B9B5_9POAL|nr:hypothetical protein HU200_040863 [Digitaria exilis]
MDIATGAMNTLLPKLVDLVMGEYRLQKGVSKEIKELEKELESMNAALRHLTEMPPDQLDELTKIWASDVRELSYDIEDNVDTFMLRCNKGYGEHTNKAKTNHQIHNIIKDIMVQAKIISERRDRYNVGNIASRPNTVAAVDPRLEAMYRNATELVGIHRPKNELAKRIFDQECSSRKQPYIISIVGFGGLGKTTQYVGGDVYKLEPLSNYDSKLLLNKRIFDAEDGCPPSLREVTGKILKKCGGVPLAIISTASLLASKPRHLQEWEKVKNSIGFGLEKNPDVEKMKNLLCLSYNDLQPHFKTCLLYLSKYPEDTTIRKDVLVLSWLAEGFITHHGEPSGKSLQEIGEGYFNELINRSLIQPVYNNNPFNNYNTLDMISETEVHACQVHDMMLELINQLSAEEGFVTTLLSDGQQASTTPVQRRKIRRLSLHNSSKS